MSPLVSVIIHCRNEEKTIQRVLEALTKQTYPLSEIEVVIADGLSTDRTRQIIEDFQREHSGFPILIVDNPARVIPSGLNAAIQASKGEYLIRLDAHSIPCPDYISRSISALQSGKAENVGGVWDIQSQNNSWIASSIAAAASHPLAVGDALYRYNTTAAYVDTVPFGAFKRELIDKIGWYDESLLTNEDYEFNTRIRQSGGRIWLDPQIRCTYFARKNLKELASQYWRYGFWKAQMIKRYPETLRPRQALPPLFVLGLATLLIASIFVSIFRWAFLAVTGLYLLVLLTVGILIALKKKDVRLVPGVPLAIATMHFTWGTSFIAGLLARIKRTASDGVN